LLDTSRGVAPARRQVCAILAALSQVESQTIVNWNTL
jgi:hypothetical protein